MAEDGDLLDGGVSGAAEHADDPSTVSLWIARRNGAAIVVDGKARLTLDFTELADRAGWTPRAKVSAFSVESSPDTPSLGSSWGFLTRNGAKLDYKPAAWDKPVRRVVVQLQGLDVKAAAQATVGAVLVIGSQRLEGRIQVQVGAKPLRITTFRARPSIVVRGKSVNFDVVCEQASSWRIEEVKDTGAVLVASSPSAQPSATVNTAPVATYRLTAKGESGAEQTANVLVKVIERVGVGSWFAAGRAWAPQDVATLCVSPEGDAIYALVRSPEAASVWWSADGFGRWDELVAAPPGMVTSAPGVCLNVNKARKLVFVGGSKVDHELTSNRVWSLDVATRTWASDWPPEEPDWTPRMGHACVVAPDSDGVAKIWVIGGADATLTALDDVHVSVDGAKWEPRPSAGSSPGWNAGTTQDPALARGRCMFGATAKDSEIWVGGGFEEPDGRAVVDIWRWNTAGKAAEQLKMASGDPFRVTTDQWYLGAFALATLDAKVWVAMVEQKGESYQAAFYPLQKAYGGWSKTAAGTSLEWLSEARFDHARIEAVGFNGCIWMVVQRYAGSGEIAASGLYYYVAPR